MKILVTGAKGFVGRNLVAELKNKGYTEILEFDKDTDQMLLSQYAKDCDFIFHLAGVNRTSDETEYMEGNYKFTSRLLSLLKENNNKAPILKTSSIQAVLENPYGISKRMEEEMLHKYSKECNVMVYIYRLTNLFGKWSKPNYNTVVATFCHNIARNLEVQINDPEHKMKLCYIDDVITEFFKAIDGSPTMAGNYCVVPTEYTIKLGQLAEMIKGFKDMRTSLFIPNMKDELTSKLYSTYLSFLPQDDFSYNLIMNEDTRGSFTEFIRTTSSGQVSVNVSKPGITKGNHWHHSKNEKFLVVKGEALIRFRSVDNDTVIEYNVSGDRLQVVDVPVGYTHSIVNVGASDLITIIWANEVFDKEKADTYFLEVVK